MFGLPNVMNGIVKSTAVRLSYVMVKSQIAISAFYEKNKNSTVRVCVFSAMFFALPCPEAA